MQKTYRRYFSVRNAPPETTIQGLVKSYQKQGSVSDLITS
jgi:hypothetical protein